MNQYFVVINRYNRTGYPLGKTICFVEANNEDEAEKKAWQQHGSDSSSVHCVFPIEEDNNSFTVYN